MKKFLNKAKMMYLTMAVLILGALGILAPVIVDLAVNKGLTWSLISTGGVLFAYATGYFLIKGGKYRWEKAMACISILVLPFLALIQFVNNQYLFSEQSAWFGSVALPTTLLWLAIIWAALLIWRFTKLNWLISTGVLLLLSLPGNYYTNKFSGSVDSFQNYMTDFLLNGFLNLLGAIACIVIGIVLRNKLKKFK